MTGTHREDASFSFGGGVVFFLRNYSHTHMSDPTVVIGAAADSEPSSPLYRAFTCADVRRFPSGCGHCRMRFTIGRRNATSLSGFIAGAAVATLILMPVLYILAVADPSGSLSVAV